MKQLIIEGLDFAQPFPILKRKGDILLKISLKEGQIDELLNQLHLWTQEEMAIKKQLGFYLFEVVSENLNEEQIVKYKDTFMKIFAESLKDKELTIRVAALKACSTFLSSLTDSEVVLQYVGISSQLLGVIVEALQQNEDTGR